MMTYISILRGINVSGQKIIAMDALRKMYEYLGFRNVQTYIQSGNVIFQDDRYESYELTTKISNQILNQFGFQVPVIVLTVETLERIITNNPFKNEQSKDARYLHVTFLASRPVMVDCVDILMRKSDDEDVAITEEALYLYCPNGYGKTKLTNSFIEAKLNVVATTRNWKTTNELLKISQKEVVG
ncbi:MAG: DUF1697 domain-containing protein [Bacteroidota bacterium]|nr:DUF1697 domain-containing protein [Bacteroidota bacterium]